MRLTLSDLCFPEHSLEELVAGAAPVPLQSLARPPRRLTDPDFATAVHTALADTLEAHRRPHPWLLLAWAAAERAAGRRQAAVDTLRGLSRHDLFPMRWRLLAGGALRRLGETPGFEDPGRPRGVAVEVGVTDGVDLLAAWEDGCSLYMAATGPVIEPAANPDAAGLQRLLAAAGELRHRFTAPQAGHRPRTLLQGRVRFSLLTPAGTRRREEALPRGGAADAGAGETFELLLAAQDWMLALRAGKSDATTAGAEGDARAPDTQVS